jgi:hypothetical protein
MLMSRCWCKYSQSSGFNFGFCLSIHEQMIDVEQIRIVDAEVMCLSRPRISHNR